MRRMTAAGPPAKRPPHIRLGGGTAGPSPAGRGLSRVIGGRRLWVAAGALIASMLGSAAVVAAESDKIKIGEFIPATSPQPAPPISFADMDGREVALGDFKGRFLVVNLWATWCRPCLKEMPSLEALQAKFDRRL